MKVLITGGAGFIGSHLAGELLENGHEVTILDNLSTGRLENLSEFKENEKLTFIEGDITDRKLVREIMEDVNNVINEAAITSVPLSVENPELTKKVNVDGTKIILEEANNAEVDRVVQASSCAVYGKTKDLPISEDSELNPTSPYGESKLIDEELCKEFNEKGLETVILRYFNVYGPRQAFGPYASVILKFLDKIENNEAPIIFGDGKQTRDFIFVKDIARGTLLSLKRKEAKGEVINLGTGKSISINQLCKTIIEVTGRTDLEPIYKEARPGDIRHSRADLSKAKSILNFEPKFSLKEGLSKLSEFLEI